MNEVNDENRIDTRFNADEHGFEPDDTGIDDADVDAQEGDQDIDTCWEADLDSQGT